MARSAVRYLRRDSKKRTCHHHCAVAWASVGSVAEATASIPRSAGSSDSDRPGLASDDDATMRQSAALAEVDKHPDQVADSSPRNSEPGRYGSSCNDPARLRAELDAESRDKGLRCCCPGWRSADPSCQTRERCLLVRRSRDSR